MSYKSRPGLITLAQTVTCAGLGCLIIGLMFPMITGTLWIPLLIGALAVSTTAVATRFFDRVQMSAPAAAGILIVAVLVAASASMALTGLLALNRMEIVLGLLLALVLGAGIGIATRHLTEQEAEEEPAETPEQPAGAAEDEDKSRPVMDKDIENQ